MKKKLILHVGLGKTGSTSIQKYLEMFVNNFDVPIHYPVSLDYGLFSEYVCRFAYPLFNKFELESLRNELKGVDSNFFVVSGEILTHSDDLLKSRVLDFFKSVFDQIVVVAYVRNPFEWNSASASQLLVDGISIQNLINWPYLETQYGYLKFYADVARKYNNIDLVVRKFEDAIESVGGIAADFQRILENIVGCSLPAPVNDAIHENKSKSMFEYLVLGNLNRLKSDERNVDYNEFIGKLLRESDQYSSKIKATGKFYQFYALDKARRSTDYDMLMLSQRFNVVYERTWDPDIFCHSANSINSLFCSAADVADLYDSASNYLVGN